MVKKESFFENIDHLIRFSDSISEKKSNFQDFINQIDSESYHYFKEISRYKNSINFIYQKTMRSIKVNSNLKSMPKVIFFFLIYRILWEKENPNKIVSEIIEKAKNNSKKDFKFVNLNRFKSDLIMFSMKVNSFSWDISLKGKSTEELLSLTTGSPTFFIDNLKNVIKLDDISDILKSMNNQNIDGNIFFRFNKRRVQASIKHTQKSIENDLKKNYAIEFKRDNDIPDLFLINVQDKLKLTQTKWFLEDYIIIQDKSSVASVYLLNPKQDEIILDACAAPGMKTQLILDYTNDKSIIISNDIENTRINTMTKINQKWKFINFISLNGDGINLPIRNNLKFDYILVDAPCTGSGTFSDNPELKWRQNYEFLNRNTMLQERILKEAYSYLKRGGTLVYSTCSLYPEEGELQVLNYIKESERIELPEWIGRPYRIKVNESLLELTNCGRFYPNIHKTKGFFIAIITKK